MKVKCIRTINAHQRGTGVIPTKFINENFSDESFMTQKFHSTAACYPCDSVHMYMYVLWFVCTISTSMYFNVM